MAQSAAENAQPTAPAAAKGKPKLLLIIVAVLVVALLGAGGFLFLGGKKGGAAGAKGAKGEAKAAPKPEELALVRLPGFLVNVMDPTRPRGATLAFLRISISLRIAGKLESAEAKGAEGGGPRNEKMGSEPSSGLPPEVEVVVKDAVIGVLSAQDTRTLSTPAGKEELRKELLAKLQKAVPKLDVREVLYEDFVMQ